MASTERSGQASAVVGLQWGDEGKGKIVDLLAAQHDAVARYNGGANAGHSVVVKGERYALHLIPSGILYPGKTAVVGNGVVVDPLKLVDEIDGLAKRGVDTTGLVLSDRAHVVMPYHKVEDGLREDRLKGGSEEIGTTRRGIGPAYAEKAQRSTAIRVRDFVNPTSLRDRLETAMDVKGPALLGLGAKPEDVDPKAIFDAVAGSADRLRPIVKDTTYLLHDLLSAGKKVLFEGANGTLLDVDHGTYPYVTASSCVTSGIGTGTGVPSGRVSRSYGVMKAYTTRVGGGPLPTELHDATGQLIRDRGREYGTTTGRPRRVGWLDLVAVKYAAMVNGTTGLALTMLDVLAGFDEIRACVAYRDESGGQSDRFIPDAEGLSKIQPVLKTFPGFSADLTGVTKEQDLPKQAREYVAFIEEFVGVPLAILSVGPGREQTMVR